MSGASADAQSILMGIVLTLAGLLFARMGWLRLRPPSASPASDFQKERVAARTASVGGKLVSIASLLFGAFTCICGLLLLGGSLFLHR
jgi:hypothetical protein